MSILDRILLVLLSIGSALAAIAIGVYVLGYGMGANGWFSLATLYPTDIYIIVAAVLLLLLAIRFLFYKTLHTTQEYLELSGQHGIIRISYETIEQLANRTGKSIRGVQEFETRVRQTGDGVALFTRVKALPDTELQTLSEQIQLAVKEYVERIAGVHVANVGVNVVHIAGQGVKGAKAWVE
ncbi:alkaline shock response membrane anchor protein AmaP [Alicyclobacillus tolerans]|uniref:Alkaline shock family protein YloU n=1 Tax=Alicyclobacillus tolerans TaxID=90970 RepID=A0ABT9LWU1_9BACL|nr:alkaline shock response membrane anchor protein AmaP [Alicyclobacillus tengchongensis]MDP9728740.1 putative alkaline shock family protein YloU [Alicyclobacillus tengchongensis]